MATKKAVNTGESINNTDIADMSPTIGNSKMSMEEYRAMQRQYDKIASANEIRLSARVKGKNHFPGKEIIDRKTNIPVTDENGEVKHYNDTYSITLTFEGGTLEYRCNEQMYNELEMNIRYLFKGYLGLVKEYGKEVVAPIFQAYEEV